MKYSTRIFIGLLMVIVSTPLFASALTFEELQAQINTLLSQVQALTAQLATLQGGVVNTPPVQRPASVCPALSRGIGLGSSGVDVQSLQDFLRNEGYFSDTATGYFGPITVRALQQWQSAQGIVSSGDANSTGWGFLGPRTRLYIQEHCGGSTNELLRATPLYGDTPLSVTFSAHVTLADSRFIADAGSYKIVFGDGAEYTLPCNAATDRGMCAGPHTIMHTYQNPGTYTAQLVHYGFYGIGPNEVVKAKTDIKVLGGGTTVETQCRVWNDGCNTCTRSYPGGPFACTKRACFAQGPSYCEEYFPATTNQAPVISEISGPITLSVGKVGTWSIKASDTDNDVLRYSITWGDETIFDTAVQALGVGNTVVQTSTFTHAYTKPGTYTVTARVTDTAGHTAQATITVAVSSTIKPECANYQQPICSAGYTVVSDGFDAAGCPLPPRCEPEMIACTADAMQCPDGSWVGRTAPGCQFRCPNTCVSYEAPDKNYPNAYTAKYYTEGQTPVSGCIIQTQPAPNTAPIKQCVNDASYVCRSGVWKIEGSAF